MSLAAKMFLSKANAHNTCPHKQCVGKPFPPTPSPLRARSPVLKPRATPAPPAYLPPDCIATIKQFEALRKQLLRQLVLYQTQLLALRMPPIPCYPPEPKHRTIPSKGKMPQSGGIKKQPSSKKIKSKQNNEAKKWEKVQHPAQTLKNLNTRRSHVLQKPKKLKKASKRKLENIESAVSNNYLDDPSNMNKQPCEPYQSYMKNYSSSSDSVYSPKHPKDDEFGLESLSGGDCVFQNSYINVSSVNEGKNTTFSSRIPRRKQTKVNKKISSAFAFDTATDEG